MTDETWDDDGIPWASPEIRQQYEAALDRFILSFNKLESLLNHQTTLERLDRGGLVKACTQQNLALKLLIPEIS